MRTGVSRPRTSSGSLSAGGSFDERPPALPPAPRARVGRLSNSGDTYAYADDADSSNDAFGDAPPDYGFDYGGTRPWVWRGQDQSERVVEPLPGGGERHAECAECDGLQRDAPVDD